MLIKVYKIVANTIVIYRQIEFESPTFYCSVSVTDV